MDLAGVAAAGWFWVCCLWPGTTVAGGSRRERLEAHSYAVLARLLDRLYRGAQRVFGLRVQVCPPIPGPQLAAAAPLLLFARHAGPGDSFLLVRALLCEAGVRPQVVLKRFLRWDPASTCSSAARRTSSCRRTRASMPPTRSRRSGRPSARGRPWCSSPRAATSPGAGGRGRSPGCPVTASDGVRPAHGDAGTCSRPAWTDRRRCWRRLPGGRMW
ncbi:hypothetical protein ACFQZC_02960 [Streptacidiphilus monticola]